MLNIFSTLKAPFWFFFEKFWSFLGGQNLGEQKIFTQSLLFWWAFPEKLQNMRKICTAHITPCICTWYVLQTSRSRECFMMAVLLGIKKYFPVNLPINSLAFSLHFYFFFHFLRYPSACLLWGVHRGRRMAARHALRWRRHRRRRRHSLLQRRSLDEGSGQERPRHGEPHAPTDADISHQKHWPEEVKIPMCCQRPNCISKNCCKVRWNVEWQFRSGKPGLMFTKRNHNNVFKANISFI